MREAELKAAARVLGISSVSLLDYIDGDLDQAPTGKILAEIVTHVRRIRPQVVITFGPEGAYGHPDHIAISQFTGAALVLSADSAYDPTGLRAHTVSKLYHLAPTAYLYKLYEPIFGDLIMQVDGAERRPVPYPEWMVTTRVVTKDYWRTVREAVACHRTQLPGYDTLLSLPDERLSALWDHNGLDRVFSTVNGGRKLETDLFEGLRGDEI
jgi:LmbE family N-acetylglucosaminyl deacetylase